MAVVARGSGFGKSDLETETRIWKGRVLFGSLYSIRHRSRVPVRLEKKIWYSPGSGCFIPFGFRRHESPTQNPG